MVLVCLLLVSTKTDPTSSKHAQVVTTTNIMPTQLEPDLNRQELIYKIISLNLKLQISKN